MTSNPSTRPDVNYLSVSGEQKFIATSDLSAVDGSLYASVLKISDKAHDFSLTGLKVPNGHETSVDCDWSTNVHIEGDFGLGDVPADNILRAKGPFRNITFSGYIHSFGQRNGIDIELGNHFDQSPGLGSGCDLTGIEPHLNGNRVTFAVGWVVPFTVKYKRGNCEYLIWQSLRLKAYVALKHLVRLVLRIPAGTKGPGWL